MIFVLAILPGLQGRLFIYSYGVASDMKKHNGVVAFLLLLIGIFCLILVPLQTVDRKGRADYFIKVNPRTFPYFMSYLLIILGFLNLISTLLEYKKNKNKPSANKFNIKEYLPVFFVFFIFILYSVILNPVGYVISTVLLLCFCSFIFLSKNWQVISIGVVVPIFLFLLFTRIGVALPA
jgi:uncharacterized membrane protein